MDNYFNCGKNRLFVVKFAVLILFVVFIAGCASPTSETPSSGTITIVLPHSGENVTLTVTSRTGGQYSSATAELNEANRNVKYTYSGGFSSGGGGYITTLSYSDPNIEYTATERYGGGGCSYTSEKIYECKRGNCNLPESKNKTTNTC